MSIENPESRIKNPEETIQGLLFCILTSVFCVLLFTSCSISHGVYHEVGTGETLWRIAKTYNIDLQDIAEANNITDAKKIEAGKRIFIPGAERVLKVKPYAATSQKSGVRGLSPQALRGGQEKDEVIIEDNRFIWPVKGEIISGFGIRDNKKHDGIDISAKEGTDVLAADDGEVMYSGDGIKGYGNLIIIQHKDNLVTVYAHNKENIAYVGHNVKGGEVIARVGNSGNSTGYHLHFEIRKDKRPMNPVFFLPQ